MEGIFLRPLSPYGFAVKTKWIRAYDAQRWLTFYERGLRYILKLNRQGRRFPEFYASILAQRILTDRPIGYVDLRSPTGAGLGALVYNYDGRVFASDEGRMLAEMNDRTFELGNVRADDYRSLILSDKLVNIVSTSLTQCAPMCSSCAFEPFCGADPVYHHATQADYLGIKPLSGFCARQKGILTLLLDLLDNSPEDAAIFKKMGRPMTPLRLSGVAGGLSGFATSGRLVLRLLDPNADEIDPGPNDAAIIRSPQDVSQALQRDFEKAVAISRASRTLKKLAFRKRIAVIARSILLNLQSAFKNVERPGIRNKLVQALAWR